MNMKSIQVRCRNLFKTFYETIFRATSCYFFSEHGINLEYGTNIGESFEKKVDFILNL